MSTEPVPYPIVKWVGGKRQLQERILAEFAKSSFDPNRNTYFEPFFGGGAILFALRPKKAVINDLNSKLVNLYNQIKSSHDEVISFAKKLEKKYNAMQGDSVAQQEFYLKMRAEFNQGNPVDAQHAALFLLLNKTGFNGMYRENAKGDFNIPFGKRSTVNLIDQDNIQAVSAQLQKTQILSGDFSAVAAKPKAGDLVYFDPPYVPLTETAAFTDYTKDGFDPNMQQKLAQVAKELTTRGVNVAISNSSHSDVYKLYGPKFAVSEFSATRMVAAKSASRKPVLELLCTNFEVVSRG
jgi:DNA adenine methylase